MGLPLWLNTAFALQVTDNSVLLGLATPAANADNTWTFTTGTGAALGTTITFTFPASADLTGMVEDDFDILDDGVQLTTAADCLGAEQASIAVEGQVVTVTICAGDGGAIAAASVVTLRAGTHAVGSGAGANQINNPTPAGSYVYSIAGTFTDTGDTRVATIDDVTMSATVATRLTFALNGVAAGTANVNGVAGTTDITTTSTTIPWGTLPIAQAEATMDMDLDHNATEGAFVTLRKSGELASVATGDDINVFDDGAIVAIGAAKAWEAPGALVANADTYGHWGITSTDATLRDNGDAYGVALFAGVPTVAGGAIGGIEVMGTAGPADSAVANSGDDQVGFSIQISALQEAANDYTTTLQWVATPRY